MLVKYDSAQYAHQPTLSLFTKQTGRKHSYNTIGNMEVISIRIQDIHMFINLILSLLLRFNIKQKLYIPKQMSNVPKDVAPCYQKMYEIAVWKRIPRTLVFFA